MKCLDCEKSDWIDHGDHHACRTCNALVLNEAKTREILLEGHGINLDDLRQNIDDSIRGDACPNCSSKMHTVMVKHDAIDLCFSCGTLFLNRSEIDRVTLGRLSSTAIDKNA